MFPASAMGQGGLGLMGGGLIAQGIGGYLGMQAAQGESQTSQNIAALQQQENVQNFHASELASRRQSMQALRNNQMARSQALAGGVEAGSQFGSSLGGAYGSIGGAAATNLLGINQNAAIGANLFNINSSINQQQMQLAKYQGQAATAAGISSLGGSLTSAGSTIVNTATNPSGAQQTQQG